MKNSIATIKNSIATIKVKLDWKNNNRYNKIENKSAQHLEKYLWWFKGEQIGGAITVEKERDVLSEKAVPL